GICLFSFFFFQAEDGIRDFHVTGVQTCALPISRGQLRWWIRKARRTPRGYAPASLPLGDILFTRLVLFLRVVEHVGQHAGDVVRSEERRVGKECWSRWSSYQ